MPDDHVRLRVLLFSPVVGRDPLSGDTSYTRALLGSPPPGVTYTPYDIALEAGLITVRGTRERGTLNPVDAAVLLTRAFEVAARGRIMFREPTWFVEIQPAAFDLVHQHLFAVRQVGTRIPVVSTAGYPLTQLYRHRERWSATRLRTAEFLERVWCSAMRIHNPWLHQISPSVMGVYSEAMRSYLIKFGARRETVRILGTGLPSGPKKVQRRDGSGLLFVGRDFELKGGDLVLEAFRRLRAEDPDLRLTVVTSHRWRHLQREEPHVEWHFELDQERLVQEVLPSHDVLVAPTFSDCGVPYSVLEAMRAEMAVVVSKLPWLDPRLAEPDVSVVEHNPDALVAAIRRLRDPSALRSAQQSAERLWTEHFTMTSVGHRLRDAYEQVVPRCDA